MNIIRTAFGNEYSQQDLWDKTAIYGTVHMVGRVITINNTTSCLGVLLTVITLPTTSLLHNRYGKP